MRKTLIELVSIHTPSDDLENEHKNSTLLFLHQNGHCTSTDNLSGHVTASAWVLSPDKSETLLTHHRKLNRWLQLGGHIENDSTIQKAALREAIEESGMNDMSLVSDKIFDIDVHKIPTNKKVLEHYHYDIRFLIQAKSTDFTKSLESNELAWVKLTEVSDLVSDESILRMCRKTSNVLPNDLSTR